MNQAPICQWLEGMSKQWCGFTRHFRVNVVRYSVAVALVRSTHLRKLAGGTCGESNSQRRRLQRFVGRELDLSHFFGEWTRSLVTWLGQPRPTLVVDETKLKDRFGVMVVDVACGQRCIPLAWRIYVANDGTAYPAAEGQVPLILALLRAVPAGMQQGYPVRVLADRGIGTSPELMRGVMALGWTFLFRVTKQSKIILPSGESVTFCAQVTQPGASYRASGWVFKQRGLVPSHVRVLWHPNAREPWALVTNDDQLTGWEYAQRMWIEQAFRDLKSHGWHVDQTQMRCPMRLAHLWIILVVAYAWLLFMGQCLAHTKAGGPHQRLPDGTQVRQWSMFRIGREACLKSHLLYPF